MLAKYAHQIGGSISTLSGSSLLAGFVGGPVGGRIGSLTSLPSKINTLGSTGEAVIKTADKLTGSVASSTFKAIQKTMHGE
jgi:hypothetical protein